jgi:DNA (cytosine-5)-methyltransferase 1
VPKPALISLFSGALGLDLGLESAGFEIRAAVESDEQAASTIRKNRPDIAVLQKDIRTLSAKDILKAAGLQKTDVAVITGGPSCQSFSTAGQRRSLADPRGGLFTEFLRIVRDLRPRFFVLENVRGILSAAVKHRPLAKRGPGHPPLVPDEVLGSALKVILSEIDGLGYRVIFDLINTASYGVPQTRQRVIFIGSRDGENIAIPRTTHAEERWTTLRDALAGLTEKKPEFIRLPPRWAKYIKLVPAGGNWRNLPSRMRRHALGAAHKSWGGRSGFFRRLSWDKPAPALTTRPNSKATLLCHPTRLRPLSVGEYARLQQFPENWKFSGTASQKYKMIGNAVPPAVGKAIGKMLVRVIEHPQLIRLSAGIICLNKELVQQAGKPRTILNPPRMRRTRDLEATRRWLRKSIPERNAYITTELQPMKVGDPSVRGRSLYPVIGAATLDKKRQ